MNTLPPRPLFRRRLAALGSLSAAGLALAGGREAEADVIFTSVNKDIGFAPGDLQSFGLNLPGGNHVAVTRTDSTSVRGVSIAGSGAHFFRVRATNSSIFAKRLPAGKTWNNAGGPATSFAFISIVTSNGSKFGGGKFKDKFFTFQFKDASQGDALRYGWMKGSLTDDSFDNLTYHLDSYAYDTTGALLATGAVPEPSSLATAALMGALVTGAAGVRRWKAARAGAAQAAESPAAVP